MSARILRFLARVAHWWRCGCGAWSIASDGEIRCACCDFLYRRSRP